MRRMKLYQRPEEYKLGWVHGFYSCGFEDSGPDDGSHTVWMPQTGAGNGNKEVKFYSNGYADGREARNAGTVARLLEWFRGAI
jgi:hypothetical protein